jgi:hypothetical protein
MALIRTRSGLSNEHLLHQVDTVVHVEGGDPTRDDSRPAIDVAFWDAVFSVFRPGRRYHFKPHGGKAALSDLIGAVRAGASNIIVCTDRDHDHVRDPADAEYRMSTRGYSWENDVWCPDLIEDLFYTVSGYTKADIMIRPEIDSAFHDFERALRWPVHAEVRLAALGAQQVAIPRDERKLIIVRQQGPPSVDQARLRASVREQIGLRPVGHVRWLCSQPVVVARVSAGAKMPIMPVEKDTTP